MPQYRVETIAAANIPNDPICCPRCKGRTLTLKGNVTRSFEERLDGGIVVEQKFNDVLMRETSEIECHVCCISWQIMTEEEAVLIQQNFMLQQSVMMHSPGFVEGHSKYVH